jgi:peptide/nickel transport system permease protein
MSAPRARRAAVATLALVGATALFADCLASDLPLAVRVDGATYLLPNLTRPGALAGEDQQTLAARVAGSAGAFILPTPIPYGPLAQHPGGRSDILAPPSLTGPQPHLLGTDDRGRDVAARLVHGARLAVAIALPATALALVVGVALGVGGALGRRRDLVAGRLIELGLTFPTLFLLLALRGLRDRGSAVDVALALGLTQWPEIARLARAEALAAVAAPHVEAARAIGCSPLRLALVHVLPLSLGAARVAAAFGLARAVFFEAALDFLGLGVPPPTASWGELLVQAQAASGKPWLLIPPTLAIAAVALAALALAGGAQPGAYIDERGRGRGRSGTVGDSPTGTGSASRSTSSP